jgi:formylglycine-generating enzyme required for sulfatase activity
MRKRPALTAGVGALLVTGVLALSVSTLLIAGAHRKMEQARRNHVLSQLGALGDAAPGAVPAILAELEANWDDVLPQLRQRYAEQPERSKRMRLALALLPVEPETVRDDLAAWLLQAADPAEVLLVRDALRPHAGELRAVMWRRLEQPGTTPGQRLRLLAALAAFDPKGAGWQEAAAGLMEPWLLDNPLYLGAWTEALRPAGDWLLPPLIEVFQGKRLAERRLVAASILADYARNHPETLAELITEADDQQFAILMPVLAQHGPRVIPLLSREVDRRIEAKEEEACQTLARRRAGAGLALARLEQAERVWPLLAHSPYPEARSRLIHRLRPGGVPALALARRLVTEPDGSIRQALILALGEYSAREIPPELRRSLVPQLLDWYRHDPDPGVHGAVDWLLRHAREGPAGRPLDWGQATALAKIDQELASPVGFAPGGKRRWYVNAQGQTLVLVDGRQPFQMGSPPDEAGRDSDETLHWRRIGRRYALGAKPVTVAQFERFLKAHPQVKHTCTKRYSPQADGPIIAVTWYEAAQYCRWLSEQEGVPRHQMVYPSVAEIEKSKDGVTPLRLPADHLKLTGYRLPTEAEWEYACRAGAKTSRYYGAALSLLPRYAWYADNARNQTWPVGQKKPNDLGLFDMHGNVWTWCQESQWNYPPGSADKPARDDEDPRMFTDHQIRVVRGGAFNGPAMFARAAYRQDYRPSDRNSTVGVRVARTLP